MAIVRMTKAAPEIYVGGILRKPGDIFETESRWIHNMRKSHPDWIETPAPSEITQEEFKKLKKPVGENKVKEPVGENKAKKKDK